jgi:hypothetical protein
VLFLGLIRDRLDLCIPCPQFGLYLSPKEKEFYDSLGDGDNIGNVAFLDTIPDKL